MNTSYLFSRRRASWFTLGLVLAAANVRAANVTVGNHLLSANTANQIFTITVSGGDAIAGEDFFLQIGDGGVFNGGVSVKPTIAGVDILGSSIFDANNNGAFGDPGGAPPGSNAAHPLIWVDGTTTASGTVSANGILATVTIDTTGLTSGVFPLLMKGVAGTLGPFDSSFVDDVGNPVAFTVSIGALTIAPGLSADFNENGPVDAADLALWKAGLGIAGAASHLQGDATGDGAVDGADFLTWQRQLGSTSPIFGAAGAVPEPTAAALIAFGIVGLLRRQRPG